MHIGQRILERRKALRLSQAALAKEIGVTEMAISKIERGISKNPSARNLHPIAKALNVDPEWLITGQGTKEVASVQSHSSDGFETSPEERALILKYRQLQDSQRTATQTMLDAMGQPKEVKKVG